jgi:hypothetical protein
MFNIILALATIPVNLRLRSYSAGGAVYRIHKSILNGDAHFSIASIEASKNSMYRFSAFGKGRIVLKNACLGQYGH